MTEGMKQFMRLAGFADHIDALEQGNCPTCKSPIDHKDFKDQLSRDEFGISGLCQHCQDQVFGAPEDDDKN